MLFVLAPAVRIRLGHCGHVPAHGVALLRIRPIAQAAAGLVPPSTTLTESGLSTMLTGGQPGTATVAFSNDGVQPVPSVRLTLAAPAGWTVTSGSASLGPVAPGTTVQAQFTVTAPAPPAGELFGSGTVSWRTPVTSGGRCDRKIRYRSA